VQCIQISGVGLPEGASDLIRSRGGEENPGGQWTRL